MSGYGPHYSLGPMTVLPFASMARTATPTAVTVSNPGNFNACLIFVSVTADPANASVVFNFDTWNGKPSTGTFVEVLDSAAVTGVSENVYYLGAPAEVTDLATVFPPTKKIRIRPVHADADSMTYSVSVYWFRR
jgi:hypothetical protein